MIFPLTNPFGCCSNSIGRAKSGPAEPKRAATTITIQRGNPWGICFVDLFDSGTYLCTVEAFLCNLFCKLKIVASIAMVITCYSCDMAYVVWNNHAAKLVRCQPAEAREAAQR